ncbi:chromate reductase [Filimonas zeae]|uniref:NAD(P)H-dependent FMN reductase n=1 Tax=Filimonas zeae TaxID=1737353 RepID=A0A917J561_9BACT|nr:NAD(P)H-dependent oxidoreductase [Filimonas zeae]MDR6340803.1 chromate reductase [Filimonas zeae]GGH78386.1 NAD(P)H-dependent FMN reductase [Filimonas zeae]
MSTNLHIVALCGSLRKESYNLYLLQAAQQLLPEEVSMEIVSIADLPLYNQDLDLPAAQERPEAVTAFRDKLAKAEGFLIASPEYNYSIPGGLKNAIDWASRGKDSPLLKKPVALIGATISLWGTVRMQLAFEPIFLTMNMAVVQQPEVLVAEASKKIAKDGTVTDETTRSLLQQKLVNLKQMILLQKK